MVQSKLFIRNTIFLCILFSLLKLKSAYAQDSLVHEHVQVDKTGIEYFSAAGKIWMIKHGMNIDRYAKNLGNVITNQPCYFSNSVSEDLQGKKKIVADFKINKENAKEVYIAYEGNTKESLYKSFAIGFEYHFRNITPPMLQEYEGIESVETNAVHFNMVSVILFRNQIKDRFISDDGGLSWRKE